MVVLQRHARHRPVWVVVKTLTTMLMMMAERSGEQRLLAPVLPSLTLPHLGCCQAHALSLHAVRIGLGALRASPAAQTALGASSVDTGAAPHP